MNNQVATKAMPGEVKALSELLQYQDGSIVSRVLLKNKGGTVTLFAFDVGEGPKRTHRAVRCSCGGHRWRGGHRDRRRRFQGEAR